MKLFRNFILIVLCLSLFAAILVSCGDDETPADAIQNGAENSESEAQTTEKSVYTGNPIDDDQQNAPPESDDLSGGEAETSEPPIVGPIDEAESNGFTGSGMELPGVTP